MQRIVSKDNKRIKRLKGLAQKKVRIKENLFLIEGTKIVEEAVAMGLSIDTLAVSDSYASSNLKFIKSLEDKSYVVHIMTDDLFKGISSLVTPQGILAALEMGEYFIKDILTGEKPVIILDRIKDPGNLGTILRTADAFGFGGVILTEGCVEAYNPKSIQASMGSILRIPHYTLEDGDISKLSEAGYIIYGFDIDGKNITKDFSFPQNCALVIGSESHGLSDELKKRCQELLSIPMSGTAESLNAAMAAGIAMYLASDCGRI